MYVNVDSIESLYIWTRFVSEVNTVQRCTLEFIQKD